MRNILLAIILVMLSFGVKANTVLADEYQAELIQSIQIEGSPAYDGRPITVIVKGTPGGTATFMVSGNDIEIKMSEIQAGIYQGMYTLRWEDAIGPALERSEGTRYVKARLTVAEHKFDEVEETFQVIHPPLMTSVSVIGSPAKTGDELIIRVTGKAGAKVLADIDQIVYDFPLTETKEMPGVYEGKRTVVEGENVSSAVVSVHFTYEGETVTDKSQRVTIDTIAPEIFEKHVDKSPLQNGSSFTLTVDCEVGAIVTVDLSQLDTTRGIAFVPEIADGIFKQDFTISYDNIAISGMKTIEITARDAAGNQFTDDELSIELRNPTLNTQELEISGQVIDKDNTLSGDAWVSVYNATSKREKSSEINTDGSYTVTFSDSKNPVAEMGTKIYVSVISGSDVIANVSHQLSPDEVLASKTTVNVKITAELKIELTVEPSVLPADGYSIAMVTITVEDADDAEVQVSAASGIIAPLVKVSPGVWTTTYTAGKTPGNTLLTASMLTASKTEDVPPFPKGGQGGFTDVNHVEILLTPPDVVSEAILIHCPLKRVIVGKVAYIRGMIDPPLFAETINLEIYNPGGISFVEHTTTDQGGQFNFHIKLDHQGIWKFRANHEKTESSTVKIDVVEEEPYLNRRVQPNRVREWKQSRSVFTDVNYLLEDTCGVLWAATNYGVYKREDEEWISYELVDNVNFLLEDSDGALWAATNHGVYKREDKGWISYGLGDRYVRSLLKDSDGALWAATNDGVMKLKGEKWIHYGLKYVNFLFKDTHGILWAATNDGVNWFDGEKWTGYELGSQPFVNSLLEYSDGVLWAATRSGVWKLTDEIRKYTDDDGLVSKNVLYLLEDNHGILWAATNSGVCWFDGEKWKAYRYGLGSVVVRYLLEDIHGVLWAATNNGVWKMGEWEKYIIEDEFVNYLLEDGHGTIIAATNNGVYWLDGEIWRTYNEGLESKSVNSLLEDSHGILWAATNDGVSKLEDGIWRLYIDGLEGNLVNFLLEDRHGTLWVATNKGVSQFDGKTWRPYSGGLDSQAVKYLLESSHGTLWAATNDGVSKLENGIWRPYIDGLEGNFVNFLLEDSHGILWAATNEGVYLYQKRGDEAWTKRYTTLDGLGSNYVNYLLFDSRFKLWAATNRGLSRFDPNKERWYIDDRLEHKCNHIIEDKNGALWLATDVGVIRYEPNLRAPQTKIEDGPKGIIGQRTMKFEYSGSDIETDSLLYSHKLDNGEWSVFSKAKSTDISADDGIHTFYVRAMDADGNVDQTPAKRTFRIDTTQPIAIIEKPAINEIIGGECLIIGTATDATDFLEYELKTGQPPAPFFPLNKGGQGVVKGDETSVDEILRIGKHQVSAGALVTWDTKGKNGVYTITLTVRDKKEGESDTQHTSETSVTVAVDNTPPTAKILSVTNKTKDNDKLSGRIDILGEIKDDHIAGYTVQCLQNEQVKWEKKERIFESKEIEIRDIDLSAIIYGDATIRLTANDLAGNESIPDEVSVFFDNEGAKTFVQLTTPKDGDVITDIVDINGTAKNSGNLESYIVEYSIGSDSLPISPEGSWQQIGQMGTTAVETGLLATWNTTKEKDGEYLLRLVARDARGEQYTSTTQPIRVIVDNTKPTASITPPNENWVDGGKIKIIGKATDINFKEYEVDYGRGTGPGEWRPIAISEDERHTEHKDDGLLVSEWNTEGIEDGEYTLRLTVTDKANLQATVTQLITLDNQPAEAEILSFSFKSLSLGKVDLPSSKDDIVVTGTVDINGTASDENFDKYEIYIARGGLSANDDSWGSPIHTDTSPVKQGVLYRWDTTSNKDGEYSIKLIAYDKTKQEPSKSVVKVKVDNTNPTAEMLSPRDNDQVGNVVTLEGTATDANFKEYIIEYGEGAHPTIWTEASEDARRTTSVTEGKLVDWLPGDKTGIFTLRLTVKDKVNHTSHAEVTVDVLPAINDKTGGETESADGNVRIYVPPNSLLVPKVITINPIVDNIQNTVPADIIYLGVAYDFEPDHLQFKRKPAKPALITISYANAPIQPHPNKTVKLYKWQNQHDRWEPIGGTVDVKKREISAAVMELGRYAIMETDIDSSGNGKVYNLTCQPRVFGVGVYHSSTAISFELSGRSKVTVKIYNLAGRLKKTLLDNEIMNPGRNVVIWDGTDEGGQKVLSGLYVIVVVTEEDKDTTTVAVLNK